MKHLIFWQNIPSIHQSALIRNIASRSGYDVTLIAESDISRERKEMGWGRPDFGDAKVIVAPNQRVITETLASDTADEIHIFTGFRAYPMLHQALKECLRARKRFGIFAEIPNRPYGVTGAVKHLVYSLHAVHLKKRISFILAVGEIGAAWYRKCNYPAAKIFPFGYFIETRVDPKVPAGSLDEKKDRMDIVFIGALIKLKAVDELLYALRALVDYDWQLRIIGDGPERKDLENMRDQLGLKERVDFTGALENDKVAEQLQYADLLILPSLHDGWGAVVSEALMAGVPVICSDRCGAAALLKNLDRGEVAKAGSVESLRRALRTRLGKGPIDGTQRSLISQWAREKISGEAAADYLINIIRYIENRTTRPVVPWSVESRRA